MKHAINKLICVICAVGTYIMAFMAAEMFERRIPMDFTGGTAVLICNAAVVYLFIRSGFDLIGENESSRRQRDELRIIHDTDITAEGFNEDYFDAFFKEDA